MKSLADIEEFRRSPEAVSFTKDWMEDRESAAPTFDQSINLGIWSASRPYEALGIVLNLIEATAADDDAAEAVAMGTATEIVERSSVEFTPVLREAVAKYPKFALYTKWMRENSNDPCWTRLRT